MLQWRAVITIRDLTSFHGCGGVGKCAINSTSQINLHNEQMSRTDKSMNNARKATTNKENIEKQQCKSEEKQEKLSKN